MKPYFYTKKIDVTHREDITEIFVTVRDQHGKVAAQAAAGFCGGATPDEPSDWPTLSFFGDEPKSVEAAVIALRAAGLELLETGRPFAPYTGQPGLPDPENIDEILAQAGFEPVELRNGHKYMSLKRPGEK